MNLVYSHAAYQALAGNRPLVALESTIIAHGLPHPTNLEVARELEAEVRAAGAEAATIAILDGRIHIGLEDEQLARLATDQQIAKASRRDLPLLLARGGSGATTVAATMACAHKAGIRVFATGGIGGVHRGGETSLDISADLTELAHTPVAVVCAGAKSILDIGRTLEYLETQGVPVIGFGTDRFPSFYCRDSGFGVDGRMDSAAEIADLLTAKWGFEDRGGVVIANPIPERAALDEVVVEAAINDALREAEARQMTGKAVTPFLLNQLERLTAGKSLIANRALARGNAALAARIAVAYQGMSTNLG
jgi:pseudouridine-5'-phosphate glycosidase